MIDLRYLPKDPVDFIRVHGKDVVRGTRGLEHDAAVGRDEVEGLMAVAEHVARGHGDLNIELMAGGMLLDWVMAAGAVKCARNEARKLRVSYGRVHLMERERAGSPFVADEESEYRAKQDASWLSVGTTTGVGEDSAFMSSHIWGAKPFRWSGDSAREVEEWRLTIRGDSTSPIGDVVYRSTDELAAEAEHEESLMKSAKKRRQAVRENKLRLALGQLTELEERVTLGAKIIIAKENWLRTNRSLLWRGAISRKPDSEKFKQPLKVGGREHAA